MSGHDLVFSHNWKSLAHQTRQARRSTITISNRLCSILDDAEWLYENVMQRNPNKPLFANMRTGSWYFPPENYCYFKSTDGHYGCWGFSLTRLNLELAKTACLNGGAIVVDATKKGKKYPDALSKTLPLWCYILNALLFPDVDRPTLRDLVAPTVPDSEVISMESVVTKILQILPRATQGLIVDSLSPYAVQPFRTQFYVQPSSRGEVPGSAWALDRFLPLVDRAGHSRTLEPPTAALDCPPLLHLVSVSRVVPERGDIRSLTTGWTYIEGAGDDVESWADPIPLTPAAFWTPVVLSRFLQAVNRGEGDAGVIRALRGVGLGRTAETEEEGGNEGKEGKKGVRRIRKGDSEGEPMPLLPKGVSGKEPWRSWFRWIAETESRMRTTLGTVKGDKRLRAEGRNKAAERRTWLHALEVLCTVLWCLDVPKSLRDCILHRWHCQLFLAGVGDDEEGREEVESRIEGELDLEDCFFYSTPDEAFSEPFSKRESLYSSLFYPNSFALPTNALIHLFPLSSTTATIGTTTIHGSTIPHDQSALPTIAKATTPPSATSPFSHKSIAYSSMYIPDTPTSDAIADDNGQTIFPLPTFDTLRPSTHRLPPLPWSLLVLVHPYSESPKPPSTFTRLATTATTTSITTTSTVSQDASMLTRQCAPLSASGVLHLRVPTDKKTHAKTLGAWDKHIFPALSSAIGDTTEGTLLSQYRIVIVPMDDDCKEAAVVLATVAHFRLQSITARSLGSYQEYVDAGCTDDEQAEAMESNATQTPAITKADIRSTVSYFQTNLKVPNVSREWIKQINRYLFPIGQKPF